MKHTSGPWRFVSGGEHYCPQIEIAPHPLIPEDWRKISINASPAAHGENEANALLIAAAPELLEALKGILEIGKRDMSNPKYDGYFDSARAAIAKAEGKP